MVGAHWGGASCKEGLQKIGWLVPPPIGVGGNQGQGWPGGGSAGVSRWQGPIGAGLGWGGTAGGWPVPPQSYQFLSHSGIIATGHSGQDRVLVAGFLYIEINL